MDRVTGILKHPLYNKSIGKIENIEKTRKFCKHDKAHFIDTARIAYILCLETGVNIDKECLYAAALLHDIGRFKQYKDGTPHEIASADIAEKILPECGFSEQESKTILTAIVEHRDKAGLKSAMGEVLYKADKLSRRCADCTAESACDWSYDKKNLGLEY